MINIMSENAKLIRKHWVTSLNLDCLIIVVMT